MACRTYICVPHANEGRRKAADPLGTAVTRGCELCVRWSNLHPLEEQQVLVTAGPSLQSLPVLFFPVLGPEPRTLARQALPKPHPFIFMFTETESQCVG